MGRTGRGSPVTESAFGIDHGEVSKAFQMPGLPKALKPALPAYKPLKPQKPKMPGLQQPGVTGAAPKPGAAKPGAMQRPGARLGTRPGTQGIRATPSSQRPQV